MTDEEKTDEQLANESWLSEDNGYRIATNEATYNYAFKKGLKAARPYWHEDPNDLPIMIEDERKISQDVWIHIKNWGGEVGYYDYRKNFWVVRCRQVNLPVLSWCEIPKYKENE